MSYERQNHGGGNRRRRKGEANKPLNNRIGLYNHNVEPDYDYHDRRQEVLFETPEQKLRTAIIKLGEVVCLTSCMFITEFVILTLVQDAVEELHRVARHIREQTPVVVPAISEGFRIGCVF